MNDRVKVMIAEDDPRLREALAELMQSEDFIELVGTAADAEEAITLASSKQVDVAIVDVRMPGGGGNRAAGEIRKHSPNTKVIALSAHDDRASVIGILRAGAIGYLIKGASGDEIVKAVELAAKDQSSLSREVTAGVIDEMTRQLNRAETLAAELNALDEMKSNLVQTLAHELFTPMTVIQGAAKMLASRDRDVPARRAIDQLAPACSEAAARIKRLVANITAAAGLDRDGIHLTGSPVTVGELLARATEEFLPQERSRLASHSQDELSTVYLWANPELAVRALVLVIENALDLSPEEEPVEIGVVAGAAGAGVSIKVSDRGAGIPGDKRRFIFGAFTQVDSSTTRRHQGLGIGLFLARRIMQAHNGTINLEPRPGGGSTFELLFKSNQPAIKHP